MDSPFVPHRAATRRPATRGGIKKLTVSSLFVYAGGRFLKWEWCFKNAGTAHRYKNKPHQGTLLK